MRKELKRFTFLLQDQKRIRDSYDKNMYKTSIDAEKYNRQREEVSNFLASDAAKIYISASLDFQKTLNEALGQKIQTIFIYDLGNENETSELFEIESLDLLKFDYNTSYQLTARYRKIDQEFLNMKRRFKHDEKLKFSLPNLKIGYTETLDRFRKSKKTSNLSHFVLFKLADK